MKIKQVIRIELIEEIDDKKLGNGTKDEKYQRIVEKKLSKPKVKEVKDLVKKLEKAGLKPIYVDYHSEKYKTPADQLKELAELMSKCEECMEEEEE